MPAGTYTITAQAIATDPGQAKKDPAGPNMPTWTGVSAPVSLRVNAPPTASLAAPAAGSVFNPPAGIAVTANAADADGSVAKVDFYAGARLNFCQPIPMPRRPRTHLHDLPLHIVQRGHNRGLCFFAKKDYYSYLHWLRVALNKPKGAVLDSISGTPPWQTSNDRAGDGTLREIGMNRTPRFPLASCSHIML